MPGLDRHLLRDPAAMRLAMIRLAARSQAVMCLVVLCLAWPIEATAKSVPQKTKRPDKTSIAPRMARHQLFFAAVEPEPILVALIIKRMSDASGVWLETKAFVAWKGRWQSPYFQRIRLPKWPGKTLSQAATAWQAHLGRGKLRLRVSERGGGLNLSIRRPQGGLEINARKLLPAGSGVDPHGAITWQRANARLVVNGRRFKGRLFVEEMATATTTWPRFGRFEMWLRLLPDGGLLLGRAAVDSSANEGRALFWPTKGRAAVVAFAVAGASTRREPKTGFTLPIGWRLGGRVPGLLRRVGGELGRGKAPGGGAAVYDISLAVGDGGPVTGGMALVFHLQDEPSSPQAGGIKGKHPRP